MANAIDGIGTINVGQMVSQLMSVEGAQQNLLKTQQSAVQSALTAYQQLNTNLAGVQTASEAIVTSLLSPHPWTLYSATSSSTSVAATATSAATPGTYSFNVQSVAAAHSVLYGNAMALTSTAASGGSVTITQNGTPTTISVTDTSLQGVVSAINGTANLGVKAFAVQVAPGSYRLQLTASSTGAASQFTASGLDATVGTAAVVATGSDASVQFGPAATDVVTSSTNTFTNVYPGLSFTVSKVESGVTVTVGNDAAGMTKQVQSLVDSLNTALSTIRTQTAYDATTKTGGPLLGESLPTRIGDSLSSAVFTASPGSTLATYGIDIDSTGKMTFDATKFQAALTSNPSGTTAAITSFATQVGQVAKNATDFATGSITTAIQGEQSQITSLGQQISDWDLRLTAKKDQLTQIYSNLNTQLTTMNNQASWLAGQFASMASATG
jgi:flagellar hook-associated protein 2